MKLFGQRIFDYGEGLHRITQGISNVVSDSKVPERLDKDRWKFDRLLESIDVDGVYNDKAIEDMTIDDMNIDSITGRIKQTIGLTNSSEAFQKAFEYFRDAQSAYLADMASDFHESQSQMQRELNNQDKGDVLASCFLYKYENDAAALAAFKEALYRRNRGSIYDLALDFMERVSSPVLIWIDPKDPEPAPEQPPAAKPIRVAKPVYKASAPSSVKTTPLSQDYSHTSRNICIGILVVLICLFGFLVHKLTAVYMDETANQNIVTPQAQTKSEPKEEKPTVIAKTDLSLCGIDIGDNKNSVYEVLQLENSNKKDGQYTVLEYADLEIFMLDGTVQKLISDKPSAKTKRGIHPGSTIDEALSAYGKDYKKKSDATDVTYEYSFTAANGGSGVLRLIADKGKDTIRKIIVLSSGKASASNKNNAAVSVPKELEQFYVVNCKKSITLWDAPSTDANTIEQIPLGAKVTFFKDMGNGFYKINYEGQVGYSMVKYLSKKKK